MSELPSHIKHYTQQTKDNDNESKLASEYSLSDLDDTLNKDKYSRPGTFFSDAGNWKNFGNAVLNESVRSAGVGPHKNIMQNFLSRLDRHGNTYAPTNTMNYGYTFITRPRFNLTTGN